MGTQSPRAGDKLKQYLIEYGGEVHAAEPTREAAREFSNLISNELDEQWPTVIRGVKLYMDDEIEILRMNPDYHRSDIIGFRLKHQPKKVPHPVLDPAPPSVKAKVEPEPLRNTPMEAAQPDVERPIELDYGTDQTTQCAQTDLVPSEQTQADAVSVDYDELARRFFAHVMSELETLRQQQDEKRLTEKEVNELLKSADEEIKLLKSRLEQKETTIQGYQKQAEAYMRDIRALNAKVHALEEEKQDLANRLRGANKVVDRVALPRKERAKLAQLMREIPKGR